MFQQQGFFLNENTTPLQGCIRGPTHFVQAAGGHGAEAVGGHHVRAVAQRPQRAVDRVLGHGPAPTANTRK